MMKKTSIAAALLVCAAVHAEPISYPGSTWGSITFPSGLSKPENHDALLTGRIEQGAVWFNFGEDKRWRLNTYMAVSYSVDNAGLGYNNKYAPVAGVKVQRTFDAGVIDIGLQLAHERRFKDGVSSTGPQAYVNWWFGWDLKK